MGFEAVNKFCGVRPMFQSESRWCPARNSAFHSDCNASVTLTIDPASGRGMVLCSAPQLWEYAFAREKNGYQGGWLYKVLHAHR